MNPTVLLVEDDAVDAALAKRALKGAGESHIDHCTTLAEALERLADRSRPAPTVVLLDLSLPDAQGIETFDRLNAVDPPPIVVISGDDDPFRALSLIERGAQDYLVKGEMSDSAIARALRQAVERARLREEVEEARDRALLAARAQSAFVAAMSHEIRTPLNAILGMSDLLSQTKLDLDQREYVEIFRRCGRALKGLLDNALELARLENGEMNLEVEPFDLEGLAYECLEAFAFSAHRKGVALVADVDDRVGGTLRGDEARLRQVLLNLLGNAVKFTETGRVMLRILPCDEGLQIEIEDTGIGIPPDRLEAVFERFVQAEAGTTRRFGGSGLGLALCREIVEAMDGEIRVESELGTGSLFSIKLPLVPEPVEARSSFGGERMIVLIGDPIERGALVRRLGERGAQVFEAESVEVAERALQAEHFDVVLLDARLPGGGGVELLERSTLSDETRRVVLLPMDHRAGDLARCHSVGAVALCKPSRWNELDLALRGEAQPDQSPQKFAAPRLTGSRILLAEDSRDNRTIALAHLSATGCEVIVAVDGQEAVERAEAGAIDMILMDMHMPRIDGSEATRQIRAREARLGLPRIPIVALTADALPEQRDKCLAAGCDAHLAKPFSRDDLLGLLSRFLDEDDESTPPLTVFEPLEEESPYDIPPELADLAEEYLGRRRADAISLCEAAESGDFDTARRLGHNMKGSGAGYGFARVSELGAELQYASEGRDGEEVKRLAGALEEYVEKALSSLA